MIFRFTGILQLRLFAKNSRKIALSGLFSSKKKRGKKRISVGRLFQIRSEFASQLKFNGQFGFPNEEAANLSSGF